MSGTGNKQQNFSEDGEDAATAATTTPPRHGHLKTSVNEAGAPPEGMPGPGYHPAYGYYPHPYGLAGVGEGSNGANNNSASVNHGAPPPYGGPFAGYYPPPFAFPFPHHHMYGGAGGPAPSMYPYDPSSVRGRGEKSKNEGSQHDPNEDGDEFLSKSNKDENMPDSETPNTTTPLRRSGQGHLSHHGDSQEDNQEEEEDENDESSAQLGNFSTSDSPASGFRIKTYIKSRLPTAKDVVDRRSRKNAQSRARAAKLRQRIAEIESKPEHDRTEEEIQMWSLYESRRHRKNNRSRERALEKKEEVERILAKPERRRSKIEKQFLDTAVNAKKRKNEGDRLRRQRMKNLGLPSKGNGYKPGISARGPLPDHVKKMHMHLPPHPYYAYGPPPHGMYMPGEIPLSPLPHLPYHPPPHHSPDGGNDPSGGPPPFSPGMPPPHMYGSPPRIGMTPGRGEGHLPHSMPYLPHPHVMYDPHHPHHHHHPLPSPGRVEQRRTRDGTTIISIGGRSGQIGAPEFAVDPPEGDVDAFFESKKDDDGDDADTGGA